MSLPLGALPPKEAAIPVAAPAEANQSPVLAHTTRILVVEDAALDQMLALKMLQRLGDQADVVTNGQEALDRLAVQSYDIILMDCRCL